MSVFIFDSIFRSISVFSTCRAVSHEHTHKHTHTFSLDHTHTHTHTHTHIHTYSRTCTHTHTIFFSITYTHAHARRHTHTHMHSHTNSYEHTHTHALSHTLTHMQRITIGDRVHLRTDTTKVGTVEQDDHTSNPYKVRWDDGTLSGWLEPPSLTQVPVSYTHIHLNIIIHKYIYTHI